jgi:hypothetical protein
MCLTTISKKPLEKKSGVGWKVFRLNRNGTLRCVYRGARMSCPEWLWLNEADYRGIGDDGKAIIFLLSGGRYRTGFHILKTENGAYRYRCQLSKDASWITYVVRKVQYRTAVAHGTQNGVSCIVAKEIKILGEGAKP